MRQREGKQPEIGSCAADKGQHVLKHLQSSQLAFVLCLLVVVSDLAIELKVSKILPTSLQLLIDLLVNLIILQFLVTRNFGLGSSFLVEQKLFETMSHRMIEDHHEQANNVDTVQDRTHVHFCFHGTQNTNLPALVAKIQLKHGVDNRRSFILASRIVGEPLGDD
jgi:galactitol-specific phosphotransferase system IIB component